MSSRFGLNPVSSVAAGAMGNRGVRQPKDFAQQTFAALTRQQWDDYLSYYVPVENELIQYATDPDVVKNAVMNARTDVAQSFDAQVGADERRRRGLGVTLEADEQRAVDRSSSLARSLADVSAANLTTERVRDRQQSLLGNPAPSIQGA
jgi:hypothetical protein